MASEINLLLEDLNPQQRAAVCHGEGQLLIFAGAGSGKTRVLTRRIANLVRECSVRPEHILAVTFTNKAAQEMKHRVQALVDCPSSSLWVSTFHSICARMLRVHAELLGYTTGFVIYDTADSLSALKRAFEAQNIDPRLIAPRAVLSQIDQAKNKFLDPVAFRQQSSRVDEYFTIVADLYEAYQAELFRANAMDFGDLLCNTLSLFTLNPQVLEFYQHRFKYIMVDEYQDTNRVQYLLIKLLAQRHRNLCVVGDDDQSIYAFRGATIENILSFRKDYPDATVVTLETNYRSTQNILTAANSVISRNEKRQPKRMITANPPGAMIASFCADDEQDEAQWITRQIQALLAANMDPKDIAVFYRTNAQSRAIEEALCECGIPYEIYGGQRFYDRKEIKDIIAYLRLLRNPSDNEALLRIINCPPRGLGATTVGQIIGYAQSNTAAKKSAVMPAIEALLAEPKSFLSPAAKIKLEKFVQLIAELRTNMEHADRVLAGTEHAVTQGETQQALARLIESIAEQSGYLAALKKQDTEESLARMENIYELCNVSIGYVRQAGELGDDVSVSSFLDRVSLISDSDTENKKSSGGEQPRGTISLMTLHLAKGLEFPAVFLTGMEEGLLPHVRSLDSKSDLEEERRLCYVGITRAKEKLHISRATNRQSFGNKSWCAGIASRFLDDIPFELLEHCNAENNVITPGTCLRKFAP